ncbi:carbohydrate kinase [Ventosimonas gracilis]|uniref:ADP-dependent (S)-NAD(P)H-hydrate dehydratase n=1 Tax=Ventosimonas gracilis TaxID=1680762 RepID=A0A139SVY0_9GAMM|nr:NAD(P)H-hydrate dehydratase [Ventosimonas gracilis]KXU38728.1 carbohydrate kinase [Ventosimonas gracilis]
MSSPLFEPLPLDFSNLPKLPPRQGTAHKGQFGHVWLLGGDHGMGGAALLAAEAALRAGAGRVSLMTRAAHLAPALTRMPELMTHSADSSYALAQLLQQADVLVAGPGLGQAPWGRSLLSVTTTLDKPQVWDADALNLLAHGDISPAKSLLITPHPGEAARLLRCSVQQIQQDRPQAALCLAKRYQATVILKGAGTLIATMDGDLRRCDRGHPSMAGPGFGDVLAGLLGALLAQGMVDFEAACLAIWLHAVAGEQLGSGGRGLLASDLLPVIRSLLEAHSPCLAH